EYGTECRTAHRIMQPGQAATQNERRARDKRWRVEAGADLGTDIGGVHRRVGKSEIAAADVALAVARGMKGLRLQRSVGSDPNRRQNAEPITGFQPHSVTLPDEFCAELIAERRARGGEPVIGKGKRGGEIPRTFARHAIDARLKCVAASAA